MLMGFGEWLEEDPRGRFSMLNRRNYTRNGHYWNPIPDMELDSLRGGGCRIFGRGFAKRGVVRTPEPPWLRALYYHRCGVLRPFHPRSPNGAAINGCVFKTGGFFFFFHGPFRSDDQPPVPHIVSIFSIQANCRQHSGRKFSCDQVLQLVSV